ncbi:T9SS type A sorting domain-containing protein [candidate division TA06 bacterium]|nr:T9SS type A sorting domain-containing protein [candidate division TA06 bacterium]
MKHHGIKMAVIGLMILAVSGSAQAQWLSLTQAGPAQKPVSLLQSGNSQIVFEINVPGFEKSTASTKGGDFGLLTIPGQGYNTAVGQPKLPVISEWLEIPQGATATAEFQILESREVSLKELGIEQKIVPVQYPVPKIEGAAEKIPFAMDDNIYSKDKFFGQAKVTLSRPVSMRAKRAVLASFNPISYNPVSGRLKIATRVKVTVNLSGSDQARTNSIYQKYSSKLYDKHVTGITINELAVSKAGKAVLPAPVNQLIIVVDSFYTGIQPLVDWDTRKGYHVTVTRTSEIPGGADTTHIRQYIQSVYDGANPPDLVLLVGDVNGIPAHRSTEEDLPYTDLYYSTMAGSDIVPDLYLSRISVANTPQLGYYLTKYLNYQQGSWGASQDWMSKAYFTSTNDPMHVLTDLTDNYCMALSRSHGITCDSLYAYYGTGTPIATAFNDGRTVMAYTGHGSTTSWSGPSFTQADINALTNAYMSTFVTSFACQTGDFSLGECFGETWIRTANKGAIAFWGSSVYSYWDEDDILQRRMFDAFLDSGYTLIGGMTVKAKLDLGRFYGWDQAVSVTVNRYFEQYNIFGNAGVDLYTQQPAALTVTHPDSISAWPSQLTVNVDAGGPVQDALVAVYRPSTKTLLISGYTDAAGNITFNINPGGAVDSLAVTVTAHNCAPYQGKIQTYSGGAYVAHLKNTVDDATGNGDGVLNPNETAGILLWLKNFGTDTAKAVGAKIRTGDAYVSFIDSVEIYGDIAPGDSIGILGFSLNVATSAPDSHTTLFTVECRDSRDTVWQSGFILVIRAPELAYKSHLVLDPAAGGNNNSILEPGESDSIQVTISNSGGQTATGTTALLSTSDPYLTITGNSASYGDISSTGGAVSAPAYAVTVGAPPASPYFAWVRLNISALSGGYARTDSFRLVIGGAGFFDNVEDAGLTAKYSVQSQWHITGQSSYSPGQSWWCGDSASGQYSSLLDASLTTPEIILGPKSELSFWHKYDTEATYDFCNVEYSTNSGSSWNNLGAFDGYQPAWVKQTYDLSSITSGTVIKVRFHFTSDGSVTGTGWYVDDIRIQETTGVAGTQTDPGLPSVIVLGLAYPNPSSGGALIKYQLPQKINTELRVYNIAGQMVRTIQMGIQNPGNQSVFWNGRDQNDKKVAAGIYFYQLNAGGFSATKKLVVIK